MQLLDLPRLEADYVQKVLRRGQPHVRAVPGQPIHQDLPAVYRDLVRRSVVLRNEQQIGAYTFSDGTCVGHDVAGRPRPTP